MFSPPSFTPKMYPDAECFTQPAFKLPSQMQRLSNRVRMFYLLWANKPLTAVESVDLLEYLTATSMNAPLHLTEDETFIVAIGVCPPTLISSRDSALFNENFDTGMLFTARAFTKYVKGVMAVKAGGSFDVDKIRKDTYTSIRIMLHLARPTFKRPLNISYVFHPEPAAETINLSFTASRTETSDGMVN